MGRIKKCTRRAVTARRTPWIAMAAAAMSLGLAACGAQTDGGAGGPGSPSATVSKYFAAVNRADGREICSYIAPQAQRDIAGLQGKMCAQAMTDEARQLPESLNAYEIVGESVAGDRATVRVRGLGSEEQILLRRLGESWRIFDAPGLGL